MTSADTAAIAVIVMAPLIVAARVIVRNSRGEGFTAAEPSTVLGMFGVAATIVAVTRAPDRILMLALPGAIVALGLVVLWIERRRAVSDRTRQFIGSAAVVVGIGGLIIAIVRVTSAN